MNKFHTPIPASKLALCVAAVIFTGHASAAEIACFAEAMAGADKGWASGMDLLEELLAELQAEAV